MRVKEMSQEIADIMKRCYSDEITDEEAGSEFANLLSENTGRPRVQRCIEHLADEEASPIIRCRDCRFFREDRKCLHERSAWFGRDKTLHLPTVDPDDFCAWGEEPIK